MSDSPQGVHGQVHIATPQREAPFLPNIIPVQTAGTQPQLPSAVNQVVQNMIPAIQRQFSETVNNSSASNTSNPFLNQIPGFGGQNNASPQRSQGHVRSFSYGNFGQNFRSSPGNGAHGNLPFHPAQQHGHMFAQSTAGLGLGGGNNAQQLHSHHGHRHHHHHQHSHASNSSSQPSPSQINASFVLDLGDNGATDNAADSAIGNILQPGAAPVNQDNNNNGQQQRGPGAQGVGSDPVSNLRTLWKASEGSVPFILLMLAKVLFQHRLGIVVLIGLFGTFYHANSSLKKQIAQRDAHSFLDTLGNLCWIIVFLSANIFFIYYVFEDQMLYRSLYFQMPEVGDGAMDVWNLCWVIGVTDFIVKYATIILKAVVTMLPKNVLVFKKKGKYYMMIEVLSQFYRSLIPVVPWLLYLQAAQTTGQWFAYVLCFLYLICKGNHVYAKLKELKRASSKFRIDVSYGSVPSTEDLQACDNSCPICQDKFTDPVMLSCTHIFCEDCVSMWFDRERTCPMCRAQIVDNPIWRDGSTAGNLQLY